MKNSIKCASFLKYEVLGLIALLLCSVLVTAGLSAEEKGKPLTRDQIKDELAKQTRDTHIVQVTKTGAKLLCPVQGIDAEISKEGTVKFISRSEKNKFNFFLKLLSYGKENGKLVKGVFEKAEIKKTDKNALEVKGNGISEKFLTDFNGIRQDFIINSKPEGKGKLTVKLEFGGVKVSGGKNGLLLTPMESKRTFTYNKLTVKDAAGKELKAEFKLDSENIASIIVEDKGATYPITIDPTVTDLDWSRMGFGVFGDASMIFAVAVGDILLPDNTIGTGVYVGGRFSKCGDAKNTRYIAAYDFSSHRWLSVGNGLDGPVYALAVTNNKHMELYAGGAFIHGGNLKSGDTLLNYIARFGTDPEMKDKNDADIVKWRPLESGVDKPVYAIALRSSGAYADVYFGGSFVTTPSKYFGQWKYVVGSDGKVKGEFDSLSGDFDNVVWAIDVNASTGTVWVGGEFSQAATDDGGNPMGGTAHLAIYKEVSVIDATTGQTTKEWKWLSAGNVNNTVNAIEIYNDKTYVGGLFESITHVAVAGSTGTDGFGSICATKDDGENWVGPLNAIPADPKTVIDVIDIGIAKGTVYVCDTKGDVYLWNGLLGSALTLNSVPDVGSGTGAKVFALAGYDSALIAAGDFVYTTAGYHEFVPTLPVYTAHVGVRPAEARNIAIYDNATWKSMQELDEGSLSPVGWAGAGPAQSNHVNAIAATCNGQVFLGGSFTQVITYDSLDPWIEVSANNIVQWDPKNGFVALYNNYTLEDGIFGIEGKLGKRTSLNGVNGEVGALAVLKTKSLPPKGGAKGYFLYVGGAFTEACGTEAHHIVKARVVFLGNDTIWYDIGGVKTQTEIDGGYLYADDIPVAVTAMAEYGRGEKPPPEGRRVYAGGSFVEPGKRIAVWENEEMSGSALGGGVGADDDASPFVYAIAVDAKDNVYIGGGFTEPAKYIVKYDKEKSGFVDIGAQMDKPVLALETDSKGSVYAGGDFTTSASGSPYIAKYSGAWLPIEPKVNGPVYDIAIDSGDVVYVGGDFSFIGDDSRRCNNIAKYDPDDKEWLSMGYGVGVEDASISERRAENQQIFALTYNDNLCELEVGGAFKKFKVGTTVNQAYSVARCALRYKITYQVCTPAIHPGHDHDHGYFSPGKWLPNKEYVVGDMVISVDGEDLFECVQAGESSISEPQWQPLGDTSDNSITWTFMGKCVLEPSQNMDVWRSFSPSQVNNVTYKKDDYVVDSSREFVYKCTAVNGTGHQGSSEPAWNNSGVTVDGDLEWTYVGFAYVELKTYSNKKLVQYVTRGSSAISVTGIPDKILDSSGNEYFLSAWTGERVTTVCNDNSCWGPFPDPVILSPFDFNRKYNSLNQVASSSYVITAHFARMIYVDKNAHGSMNGRNWADAYTDLQDALDESEPYDMILVAKGTYYPDQNGDRNASFHLKKFVKLYGGFDGTETFSWDLMKRHSITMDEYLYSRDYDANETILSGDVTPAKSVVNYSDDPSDNAYHVITGPGFDYNGEKWEDLNLEILDEEAVEEAIPVYVDGVTISGGYADGDGDFGKGGGMLIKSIPFFVRHSTFKNNFAKNGGGVYVKPTFMDPRPKIGLSEICHLALNNWSNDPDNKSWITPVFATVFEHVVFVNNTAVTGGAVAEKKANICIFFSTIAKNNATLGGAISLDGIPSCNPEDKPYPFSNIVNSIFYANKSTDASTFDNVIQKNGAMMRYDFSNVVEPKKQDGFVYPGRKNMSENPEFVSLGSTLEWDADTEYLTGDVINVGALKEKYVCVVPGISAATEPDWEDVAPDIGNMVEDGVMDPMTGLRLTWQKQAWDDTIDVHLKSTAGHYTVNGWVFDPVTSTSIDRAAPVHPLKPNIIFNFLDYNTYDEKKNKELHILYHFYAPVYFEPARNGGNANMGAYGESMYASKTWDVAGFTDAIIVTNPGADDSGSHGLRVGLSVPHKYPIEWIAQGPGMSSGDTVTLELYKGGVLLGQIDSGIQLGNVNSKGVYVGYYEWDIEAFSNNVAMLDYGTDYYIKAIVTNGIESLVFSNFTINRYYQVTFQTDGTNGGVIQDTYGKPLNLPFTISVLSGQPTPAYKAFLPTLGDIKFVNWQWDDPLNPGNTMYSTHNPIDAIVTGDMSITAHFGGPLTLTLLNCSAADGSESPITIYESDEIQLIADVAPSGTHFAQNWTATPTGGSFDDPTQKTVIYTMAGTDVTVSPEFVANATHTLTIIDGTVEPGNTPTAIVAEGEEVVINADDHSTMAVPEHFTMWTVESGASDGFFDDVNNKSAVYSMGTGDVTLKANYQKSKTISLTVVEGAVNPPQNQYYEQTTYELVANPPAAGSYFVQWSTNDGGSFDDDKAMTTHYTTPSNDATVTAEYRPMPILTVENGTLPNSGGATSGAFVPGAKIAIHATGTGYFVKWSTNGGGDFVNEYAADTDFTMPTNDVTITASFSDSPTLIVINGQGSGEYASGSQVEIIADTPQIGDYFSGWTDNAGSSFTDASKMTTKYTMPDRTAVVTANYATNPILTVINGTPAGDNPTMPGSKVPVTADNIPGQYFSHWAAEVNGVQDNSGIADPNALITVYTMPNADTKLTAVYTVEPELVVINGIDRSGAGTTHSAGTRIPIMAVAPVAGMHFKGWITEDGGAFGDASAISTDYTMPDNKSTVKAVFVWTVKFEVAVDPSNPDVSQGTIVGLNPQDVENNASASEVTARANPGYKFKSWDDGSTDNPRVVGNIVADSTYVASFEKDPNIAGVITMGIVLQIPSADFPNGTGKVFGTYVEGGKQKFAPAKQIKGSSNPYLAEWVRRIRLYNIKSMKSAYKQGITTDKWLLSNPMTTADCMMSVKAGKQTAPLLRPRYLITPPHIIALKSWDGAMIDGTAVKGVHMSSIILLEGEYFGTKLPKVYIEYKDYSDKLKHKKLKVVKILNYPDASGKENKSCMDVITGISKLYVQMPRKWWQDWGTKESYLIILDNGFGIDTVRVPTIPSGQNTSPKTGTKIVHKSTMGGAKYLIIDVLNDTIDNSSGTPVSKNDGCSDAEADALKITLPSKASANGSKLSVYKKTKIKYTPSGSVPDTFSYTVDDGHGGVKNGTVIIEP